MKLTDFESAYRTQDSKSSAPGLLEWTISRVVFLYHRPDCSLLYGQILVQPFVAQYFLYDRIISNCVFRRAYASGDLDANLISGDGMVGFDGLAHGIGGLESGSRVSFAGRGLDEVRAGILARMDAFWMFSVVTKAPVSRITFKWAWRQLSLISCNSSVSSSKLSSMK